jgi:KDO2-lipid IV(A) lauroyltransferase
MIDLKDIASSPHTIRLGMATSRYVPEGIGHCLAWLTADLASRFKPTIYQTVRANLAQVLGPGVEGQTLEQSVRRVFYTTLRSYFDLFRALRLPREELTRLVEIPDEAKTIVRSLWHREGGSVLVFPHLGNFDLGGQAAAAFLPETQVLSLPDPPPGFLLANKIRQLTGVKVTPLSSAALRQAIRLLRRGGVVSLAGDRPVSDLDEPVPFFGLPARVPSGHVRLALKTGAVVVLVCCVLSPDGRRYTVHVEPPLEMLRTGNLDEEIQLNMRRVLDALETVIRRWPDQWQMFVPVWPRLQEA